MPVTPGPLLAMFTVAYFTRWSFSVELSFMGATEARFWIMEIVCPIFLLQLHEIVN